MNELIIIALFMGLLSLAGIAYIVFEAIEQFFNKRKALKGRKIL